MAYNNTYSADDIAPATINTLAVGFIVFVSFVPLVALVFLYKWFKKNVF